MAYGCGQRGRKPAAIKVQRIGNWLVCSTVTDVRVFIGLCVYYRIWIWIFSVLADSLCPLMKKKQDFECGEEQQKAMDTLKLVLTAAPALKPIVYDRTGQIFLLVYASLQG